MIRFVEDLAKIEGLTDAIVEGINTALDRNGQAGISISRSFGYGREVWVR
jgi:hypothetical protein